MKTISPTFYATLVEERTMGRGSKETTRDLASDGGASFVSPEHPTAVVTLKLGLTKKLPHYESRRGDVSLTVPMEQENLETCWPQIKQWVSRRVAHLAAGRFRKATEETPEWRQKPSRTRPDPYNHEVTAGFGRTISMGDFNFARVDVVLTLLADANKIDEAYTFAQVWVVDAAEKIAEAVKPS